MDDEFDSVTLASVACFCCVLAALVLAALLVMAYAFVVPVRVTVDEATLGRLTVVDAAPGTNGTTTGTAAAAAASVAYDVSVAVALHNRNWGMAVWRQGPLDAELRFRGHPSPFARDRLAGAEPERDCRIRALRRKVYRLYASGESAPVLLGPDAAAELSRERAAGVFELELAVLGAAKYEAHPRRRSIRVTCPLKLPLSTATAPAALARVKCA